MATLSAKFGLKRKYHPDIQTFGLDENTQKSVFRGIPFWRPREMATNKRNAFAQSVVHGFQ